jgi:WD40 repeat protein
VTATLAGELVEWDARTGARRRVLAERGDAVHALRFTRDGARLYIQAGATTTIWDVERARADATIASASRHVLALDLAPDERTLVVSGGDERAKLWDARTGAFLRDLRSHGSHAVLGARFSADGARVVTVNGDNAIRVFDAATGTLELALETTPTAGSAPHSLAVVIDAVFSFDGASVLSAAGADVQLWRADRAPLLLDIPAIDVAGGGVDPAGERVVAVGAPGRSGIWSLDRGALLGQPDTGTAVMTDAAWSPDGHAIAVVGAAGYARVFHARGGAALFALAGHTGIVNCVAYRPDGARVVTCGDDRTARIHDATTGAAERVLVHPDRVMAAAWSRNGRLLATAGWDGVLRVWDAASGMVRIEIAGGTTQFLAVAFTPDERGLIAGGHEGSVAVWELATGARRLALEGHTGPVTWVEYSPDGGLIATTADDLNARIWDPRTGKQLAQRMHGYAVMRGAWHRDGQRLLTISGDGHVRVWDAQQYAGSLAEAAELGARFAK